MAVIMSLYAFIYFLLIVLLLESCRLFKYYERIERENEMLRTWRGEKAV